MEKKVFMASCPICGRSLFKGKTESYIEGSCPKCKNYLRIFYTLDGVKSVVCTEREENRIQ